MGLTSENVAAAYGIPRDRQDQMAADSHKKAGTSSSDALEAQKNGWFKEEIVPVTVEDGSIKKVLADKDEGPRPGTTPESLSKMKPVTWQRWLRMRCFDEDLLANSEHLQADSC
eukprot:Skav211667  [mRNA]  locus=scaffold216:45326:46473:+ [translate_table: standard]